MWISDELCGGGGGGGDGFAAAVPANTAEAAAVTAAATRTFGIFTNPPSLENYALIHFWWSDRLKPSRSPTYLQPINSSHLMQTAD
jgi:hypothetical protein